MRGKGKVATCPDGGCDGTPRRVGGGPQGANSLTGVAMEGRCGEAVSGCMGCDLECSCKGPEEVACAPAGGDSAMPERGGRRGNMREAV